MNGICDASAADGATLDIGEACPAAHLLIGPDGRVRDLNQALARILGYGRREILGRHVLEFVHPRDTGRVLEQLGRGAAADSGPALEVGVLAKDGTCRTLLLTRTSTSPAMGLFPHSITGPGVLLTGIDISDSKAALELGRQKELTALRDRHAHAMASFARGVATRFEDLLALVADCADKLRTARPADAEAAQSVEKALGGSTRCARVAAALSRMAAGPKIELGPVAPADLIDSAVVALRPVLGGKIKIVTNVAAPLPPLWADAGAMREALVELGLNAHDATPAGGTFTMSAESADIDDPFGLLRGRDLPAAPSVRLRAADTGEGMDEATLARAFEPFFTTRNPDRRAGLGLAKVQSCIAAHHGSVSISSAPSQGTTVTILLPVAVQGAS